MMQIRTINAAIEELRSKDQDNCLTKNGLRQLIITGKIPSVSIGNKYLVSMETLSSFLQGSVIPQPNNEGIRRLNEKIKID